MNDTIPCEICGTDSILLQTKRCTNCWEVEHRLEDYLKNPKGFEFVEEKVWKQLIRNLNAGLKKQQ